MAPRTEEVVDWRISLVSEMGGGKKAKALKKKNKHFPSWTVNCSVTARNLRKSDLGGVIFGCKNNTIKECYFKQLFGLPAPHFSYVRNIDPGMTLFLFNYSDRKLHGIFESASTGELNINPHGWTSDGSELTPFGAQVRVRVRMQCLPLPEEQFKPVLSDNYYEPRLFWFELDRAQTSKLASLFLSSVLPANTFQSKNTVKWNNLFQDLPALGESNMELSSSWDEPDLISESQLPEVIPLKLELQPSHPSLERSRSTSLPQKKWSSLFDTSATTDTIKGDAEKPVPDQLNMEWESTGISDSLGGEELFWGAPTNEWGLSSAVFVDEGSQPCGNFTDEDGTGVPELELKPNCESSYSSVMSKEINSDDDQGKVIVVHPEDKSLAAATDLDKKSPDSQFVIAKLMQEMELWKVSDLIQKVSSLEQKLDESKREIQKLKTRCQRLESGSFHSTGVIEEAESGLVNKPQSSLDDSILLVGGFDGSSWLVDLDSYSPSLDLMKSLKPMSFVRSYASVAKLNGELYICGGVDGNLWHNTVESYNPISDQWFSRPSLNQRKGSLAGVSLYDRIFAIGGGNGVECFSEVEALDLDSGRWFSVQPMLQKRFGLAAAEINGILYAVGGYDGEGYLDSVERLDPREHSWTRLRNMRMRRGCHSLVVLNEKLYALGGYNGAQMVPDVEIFDPHAGSWMIGEPMNDGRGYCGAVVSGRSIYVIGGLKDDEEVLDTVEYYKEGHSWQVTSLQAVGKRCFFSATVL